MSLVLLLLLLCWVLALLNFWTKILLLVTFVLNQSLKCRVTRRSSLNWIYGLWIIYFYSFNYYFLPKKEIKKKKKTTSFFIIFKCFVLKRQAWKPKNISTKNKKYVINKIGKKSEKVNSNKKVQNKGKELIMLKAFGGITHCCFWNFADNWHLQQISNPTTTSSPSPSLWRNVRWFFSGRPCLAERNQREPCSLLAVNIALFVSLKVRFFWDTNQWSLTFLWGKLEYIVEITTKWQSHLKKIKYFFIFFFVCLFLEFRLDNEFFI